MVAVLATFAVGVVGIVMNKLWDPIADCVGNPFHVRRRVEQLGAAAERLQEMRDDFLRLDPRPSSDQRRGWLSRVQALLDTNDKTKIRYGKCRPLVNYLGFCDLGVEATRELDKADGLIKHGENLLQEARAKPHPIHHPNVKSRHVLFGMDAYKTKVLDFIKDEDPKSQLTLGIWGMGGVGKSSLLKLLHDSELLYGSNMDDDPFHHVLYVSAGGGRGCTVTSMQHAIATSMGLPSVLDSQADQKHIIFNHLQDRSFLLLLDDLCEYIDLEKVGIPMAPLETVPTGTVVLLVSGQLGDAPATAVQAHRRRKVVFTTRSWDVCCRMGCLDKNTIRINCLSEADAWSLFARQLRNNNIVKDDKRIHRLATEMVEECGGLPLALCTIGKAMSAKTDVREWRSALDLFNKSKLREITDGTDEELFKILKRSYDGMQDTLKKCFLICSLWPEDENIPREKLIGWWMGLGLVHVSNQGVDNGHSIISCLIGESMLEKGDAGLYSTESSHVKMHTVTRKMALWIVNDRGDKERWLPAQSFCRSTLPEDKSFCRSTLPEDKWCYVEKAWIWKAWILPADTVKCSLQISFPQLIMLVIRHDFSLEHTGCFQEITFLDLAGTKRRRFPPEICELTKLQHLNLSATAIDALPPELGKLQNLRCLNVRDTGALKTIPQGLILQLKRLQELDLFCTGSSFPQVEYLSQLVAELASPAIHLPILGFTVQTRQDVQQLGKLSGVSTQALCIHHFKDKNHQDIIDLRLLSDLAQLRELTVMKSSQKELVLGPAGGLLPLLEVLELKSLLQLDKVTFKDAQLYIRVVDIYRCKKLRDAIWVKHLKCLEQLTIAYCEQMERLFDSAESPSGADFPKLERLYLEELPQLSKISQKHCKFQELSYVRVTRCQRLNAILVDKCRVNKKKIRIDCNEDWWTTLALEQSQVDIWSATFCF